MNKNVILIGMKGCGKSTTAKLLAQKLNASFLELDERLEKLHLKNKKERLTCREIYRKYGENYFRSLEKRALKSISLLSKNQMVIACGGGTPLERENQKILMDLGLVVFLDTQPDVLLPRILDNGIPAYFPYPDDPKKSIAEILEKRRPIYTSIADYTVVFSSETPNKLVEKIINVLDI